MCAIVTIIALLKCPSTKDKEFTVIGTHRCVPLPNLWTSITLATIASFMLGLFATNVLNRWWATRAHVNSVGGGCKGLTMLLSAWTADATGEPAVHCEHAVRLINFAHGMYIIRVGSCVLKFKSNLLRSTTLQHIAR